MRKGQTSSRKARLLHHHFSPFLGFDNGNPYRHLNHEHHPPLNGIYKPKESLCPTKHQKKGCQQNAAAEKNRPALEAFRQKAPQRRTGDKPADDAKIIAGFFPSLWIFFVPTDK